MEKRYWTAVEFGEAHQNGVLGEEPRGCGSCRCTSTIVGLMTVTPRLDDLTLGMQASS